MGARLLCLVLVGALLAGCGTLGRVTDRAGSVVSRGSSVSLDASGPERRRMRISVPQSIGSAEQIREAAVSEANKYCINRFGSSEKVWAVDEGTGDWAYVVSGNRVVFLADCTG